jgi:hypothetical protein
MARDENMIAGLRRERVGYVARGDAARVAQVDEQLAHYGYEPEQDAATDTDGGPKGRTADGGQRTADAAKKTAAKKTAAVKPPAGA